MANPTVAKLRQAEAEILTRVLTRQVGAFGLCLSMSDSIFAHGFSRDGWARLCLDDDQWRGDVRARADESLPFADAAFRMVVLEHVLEWTAHAAVLLDEAARVLDAGGYLAVTGFHPLSPWMPWLLCRRQPRPLLTPPGWLRQHLSRHGFDQWQIHRCGAALPLGGMHDAPAWLAGGFVLVARKRRAEVMPLTSAGRVRQKNTNRHGAWVPGTQRECA